MAKNTAKKQSKKAVPAPDPVQIQDSEPRVIGLDRLAEMMRDSAGEVNRLRTRAFSYYRGNEDIYLMQLVRDLNDLLETEFGVTEEE